MIRRLAAVLLAALMFGCSKPAPSGQATLNFSILSAEDAQKMSQYWQPLIDDMQKAPSLCAR